MVEIGRHVSLHLNFWGRMERVKGIEPSYSAWKAAALPLSYTRMPFSMPIRATLGNGPSGFPARRIYPFDRAAGAN
jgi:hypothetical protein